MGRRMDLPKALGRLGAFFITFGCPETRVTRVSKSWGLGGKAPEIITLNHSHTRPAKGGDGSEGNGNEFTLE